MKRFCKIFTAMLTMVLLVGAFPVAASGEPYTYTVTFDAGNQGTISGTQGISVKSSSAEAYVKDGKIVVNKLNAGDTVSFDAHAGAVELKDSGKYYIKGVRQSGRDNDEVASGSFPVTGDQDYVVAYGIKGDMVSYTVHYRDANGKELAPSRTYYGNIGDKPIVAYLYVNGYNPKALALTKTLSANEVENVFTFEYRAVETSTTVVTRPGTTTSGGTGTPGTVVAGQGAATAPGTVTPGETGTTDENAGASNEGTDENTTTVEEEEVPQDLVDLDDEEAPKANIELDKEEVKKGFPMVAGIGVSVVAIAALIVLIVFLRRNRH